ncbi:thioredoxin domain-containing protein [Gulosibacter macacae]|uniref:Thioredoxin domain-containing protein n=1 Tax=Gulosibacter macacae TaxID=2488791 RepID=A0A3P3W058_9MICO|nr:thioredoxin domain-containing protein [Gulosibacter macacae]RRJ87069.1 thioredoxin domain-containing protein [Gulosibacter macacae]
MNRLADAPSSYLRQHADNPIDWWPWGEDALAEAARRNVPLFISIGYAACHWCHVMAHESFEDPAIAAYVNEHFVAIKVDREERPDVDAIYLQATEALAGQAGWPMTVFATPSGRPFAAGTYFPPERRGNMPSFLEACTNVAESWHNHRDALQARGERVATGLRRLTGAPAGDRSPDLDELIGRTASEFDARNGGFGGAPKFPGTPLLTGLLALPDGQRMALRTLDAIEQGGIHDLLIGGFARYTVDDTWTVPHFEKMLADNAQLLGAFAVAARLRPKHRAFADAARGIVGWLETELRTASGAFATSLDADAAGEEGSHAVFTRAEFGELLGDDAEWAASALGVTEAGTFERGASVLRWSIDRDALSDDERARLERVLATLRSARARRPQPARDESVIAEFNGLAIDSLVRAALILDERGWLATAQAAAEGVWSVHWNASSSRLVRASRDGVAGSAPGTASDYGALALGFIRLAAATGSGAWMQRAELLLTAADAHFAAPGGGWFDAAGDVPGLFVRPRELEDDPSPSGTSLLIAAHRLLARVSDHLDETGPAAAGRWPLLEHSARWAGWALRDAAEDAASGAGAPAEIVITAPDAVDAWPLAVAAAQLAPSGSVVVIADPESTLATPLLEGRIRVTEPTAFVCRNHTCRLPVTDAAQLPAAFA